MFATADFDFCPGKKYIVSINQMVRVRILLIIPLLALLLLFRNGVVVAQTTLAGGRGMLRVQSAQTIQRGSFLVSSFFTTFLKKQASGLVHDHTWHVGLTYGLSDRVEVAALIRAYQDDQRHSYAPPGHSELSIKWHWPLSGRRFHTGGQALLRLPTTQYSNVPFEPFSSGKVAWGAKFLTTFDVPGQVPLQLSANVGYFDHNIGTFLTQESTDQLLFGLGFKVAARAIIFYTEYTGEVFIKQQGLGFRNNSMRLTHGFKFKAPFHLLLDLGADFGLSRMPGGRVGPVHEYADWKVFAGLTYHFVTKRVWGNLRAQNHRREKRSDRSIEQLRTRRENVGSELDEILDELETGTVKKEK